jgi:hypothetical protein
VIFNMEKGHDDGIEEDTFFPLQKYVPAKLQIQSNRSRSVTHQ